MTSALLAWTVLTLFLWKSGSSQILQQEPSTILYPELLSNGTVSCFCLSDSCDSAYWFRTFLSNHSIQFLLSCNYADRCTYGDNVTKSRFKVSSSRGSFSLRIIRMTEEDAGIYSCVLKDKKRGDVWGPGATLRPGESALTTSTTVKPKRPGVPVCRCKKKKKNQDQGCGSMVLWPLVGLIAGLAVALVCTLYYFSRLPKKCRHHFVKKSNVTKGNTFTTYT